MHNVKYVQRIIILYTQGLWDKFMVIRQGTGGPDPKLSIFFFRFHSISKSRIPKTLNFTRKLINVFYYLFFC